MMLAPLDSALPPHQPQDGAKRRLERGHDDVRVHADAVERPVVAVMNLGRKLRIKPCLPDAQNAHLAGHPTWDETQTVRRVPE